jgi:hypothetical protein
MCIDLFCFGRTVDVPFMWEQIWLRVCPRKPQELSVTEVYDVLLKNPSGSDDLTEIWALFPHRCSAEHGISPKIVEPYVKDDQNHASWKYDWPFGGPPEWSESRSDYIARKYIPESRDTFEEEVGQIEGKQLAVEEIIFPDVYAAMEGTVGPSGRGEELERCETILDDERVQKTLVNLRFPDTPLKACETGWLRLIVEPQSVVGMPVQTQFLPGIPADVDEADYALWHEQRLDVTCPLVLRSALFEKLAGWGKEGDALRRFLRMLTHGGTSTRIGDHRIALVLPHRGIDVHDTSCTTKGVYYYGMIDLKRRARFALLWGCGSERNPADDLVHNAMRVIDRLALFGPEKREALAVQLSPSGKYEAFCLLINIMKEAHLLKSTEDDTITLNVDEHDFSGSNLPKVDTFDFRELRRRYASRDVKDEDKRLVLDFRDLHPFRVLYRAVWQRPSEELKALIARVIQTRQIRPPE